MGDPDFDDAFDFNDDDLIGKRDWIAFRQNVGKLI
jgi:hypothetical protein